MTQMSPMVARVWWIPIYNDLLRHRNLHRIKHELKVHRVYAMGMVATAYLWLANEITEKHQDGFDAVLELEDAPIVIDGEVDYPGFFDAMCKVGWFVWDAEHSALRVVRYFEKNGAQALKRAREQGKKVHQRRRGEEPSGEEPGNATMGHDAETPGHDGDATGTRRGRDGDGAGTRRGHDGDTTGTGRGRHGDQQEQEEEEEEQNKTSQPVILGAAVGDEAASLAGWLAENLGITRKIAGELVGEYPGPVLLTAGKMAMIARQQGWKGNLAGYVINRLKDGSAAAAVQNKQLDDDVMAAKEWARRFLANDAAAQQAVFAGAVKQRPTLERAGKEAVLSVLPNEAMLALAALLADRVERGDLNGRDVAAAFTAYVARIGGGA